MLFQFRSNIISGIQYKLCVKVMIILEEVASTQIKSFSCEESVLTNKNGASIFALNL